MRRGLATIAVLLCLSGCTDYDRRISRSREAAREEEKRLIRSVIEKVLQDQVEAWNRGDIEEYMQGYWNSEELVFVGSSGVTRGWQGTLNRYKARYPDRAAMGKLTFEIEEIVMIGENAATVLGSWQLEREKDRPGGVFTLVMKRLPEGWRIVQDHTSAVEKVK